MKEGDKFTIAGVYATKLNPRKKWWTFWRPQYIETNTLKVFTILCKV